MVTIPKDDKKEIEKKNIQFILEQQKKKKRKKNTTSQTTYSALGTEHTIKLYKNKIDFY